MEGLFSRNMGFIAEALQGRISKTKVLLVGCGLGSLIAEVAARIGFSQFWLWDYDKVEVSNLNRQGFFQKDIGRNKAVAIAEVIRGINPDASVIVSPRFLGEKESIEVAVGWADLVVNMSDPDYRLWAISGEAHRQGKPEFHPLNLGWMGYCLITSHNIHSLKEIVGGEVEGVNFYLRLLQETAPEALEGLISLPGAEDVLARGPIPQLGPTSSVTAALVVTGMIRLLAGDTTLPLARTPLTAKLW